MYAHVIAEVLDCNKGYECQLPWFMLNAVLTPGLKDDYNTITQYNIHKIILR